MFYTKDVAGMLSDIGIFPHDETTTIYKYRSFDVAKLILQRQRIRFSTPARFSEGDPNELNMGLLKFSSGSKSKVINDFLEIHGELPTPYEVRMRMDRFPKIIEEKINALKHKFLLLSLSSTYNSAANWEKYGDMHAGVCIGLKFPEIYNVDNFNFFCLKTVYRHKLEPMEAAYGGMEKMTVAAINWLFTKHIDYANEKEIRVVIPNFNDRYDIVDGNFEIGLAQEQICEIYFGANTPQNHIDEIKEIIDRKKYNIETIGRVKASKTSFELDFESY